MAAREKTVKVGPKGQVVIPKSIREELGIAPGERVRVSSGDGEVRVRRVLAVDELQGLLKDGASTADLEAERRRERELEAAKVRRSAG